MVIAIVLAIVLVVRSRKRRALVDVLGKRDNDSVRYAFVINPSKPQASEHRRFIASYCANHGLNDIEFIETQLDKDGRVCAQEALDHGADVVIAVGGDGTVRTVASALSGTGHAMGIIPIGTGNLSHEIWASPWETSKRRSPWQPRMGRGMWTWGA